MWKGVLYHNSTFLYWPCSFFHIAKYHWIHPSTRWPWDHRISSGHIRAQLHHFSPLVVFLQKSRKAKIAERMEQGLVVTHLQKHPQAARRTCKIKELLRKSAKLCSLRPNKKHGSLNVPIFHITQPLGIWSIMATIRWCPIAQNGTFTKTLQLAAQQNVPKNPTAKSDKASKEGGDFLGFFYTNSTRKPCQGRFQVCDKGIFVAWPILKNIPHVS